MVFRHIRVASGALTLLAIPAAQPLVAQQKPESGAYIAMLGSDTLVIERFTRAGNKLVVDAALRSPSTTQRHFVITYGANGQPTGMEFDAKRLNNSAPPTRAEFTITADGVDTHFKQGQRDTTLHMAASNMMPYVGNSFVLLEDIFMRARAAKRDSVSISIAALGAGAPAVAVVRTVGKDSMTISVAGQAPLHARVDAAGRLLGLQGRETTQKIEVSRAKDADVAATVAAWSQKDAAGQQFGVASPADSVIATVGGANVSLRYSSPAKRGRQMLGFLIPYNEVWRTGANSATVLRTDTDLMIGGALVPAGSYTLWTLADKSGGAKLIINKQFGQWGTEYHPEQDLARVDLVVSKNPAPIERFKMMIDPTPAGAMLGYAWDDLHFTVPVTVKK